MKPLVFATFAALALTLTGCATGPTPPDPRDACEHVTDPEDHRECIRIFDRAVNEYRTVTLD